MEKILKHIQEKKHPIVVIAVMLILVGGIYMWNESGSQNVEVAVGSEQVAQVSYTPLQPLPGQKSVGTTGTVGYLQRILFLGIGLAFVLAVLMIVIGGVQYMASDAFTNKEDAKQKITMALLGLLIALGGYLLLNTINPDLVTFKFSPATRDIVITKPTSSVSDQIQKAEETKSVTSSRNTEGILSGIYTPLPEGGFRVQALGDHKQREEIIKEAAKECQKRGNDVNFVPAPLVSFETFTPGTFYICEVTS